MILLKLLFCFDFYILWEGNILSHSKIRIDFVFLFVLSFELFCNTDGSNYSSDQLKL